MQRNRQSRIAQAIRAATGKCHLLLVSEQQTQDKVPDEFVTDVLIRLQVKQERDYSRRTIEIAKVRGQSNVRGSHHYVIRDGTGSSTLTEINPDDPDYGHCYFFVFHSLYSLYRHFMQVRREKGRDPSTARAAFGIHYLDEMLGGGLVEGTVTGLIGDEGTYKSRLGRAFLRMF